MWDNENSMDVFNFIKFGEEKNILDLFENGTIYCNTLEYFRKVEDDYVRGDIYEGTYKITNKIPENGVKLEIKGKELSGTLNKFHLREYYSNIDANLYCLTAIIHQEIESLGTLTLDIANTKFGSHFLEFY